MTVAGVNPLSAEVRRLASAMLFAMKRAGGVGLAANQLAVSASVVVHGVRDTAPTVLINPVLVRSSDNHRQVREGCLSLAIPDAHATLFRPDRVDVAAFTIDRRQVWIEAGGYLAHVLQHELDHLDGIEYVQRTTGSERERLDALLNAAGIDTDYFPPRPYGAEG